MNCVRRHLLKLLPSVIATILVALSGQVVRSQATRTIKIVVPFAAGGPTDTAARVLAAQVGEAQRPAMVIENRPGAGGVIGTEAVSRAAPDGNTVLINSSAIVINSHLRKVNYDALTSFEPVCYLVKSPLFITVNSGSPHHTLADLLNAARTKPADVTMAGAGPATNTHIAVEMLKRAAKVNVTFVPYPGNAPAISALLGDHVTSALLDYSTAVEHLNASKLHALATTSRTRIDLLADVPTVAESGYNGYETDVWFGLFAPAKTPKEKVSQLAGWFTAALQAADVKAKLIALGLFPVGTCGTDFAAFRGLLGLSPSRAIIATAIFAPCH
jgi:tripartite-type tricarboxylate transporter receptor subunit TctC